MEAVSFNANPVEYQEPKKSHPIRNGFLGAAAGIAGGSTIGYLTKKVVKDGAFSDDFVHSMFANLKIAELGKDSVSFSEIADASLKLDNLRKIKDTELTVENVKELVNKNKELYKEELEKLTDDNALLNAFKDMQTKYKEGISSLKAKLSGCYDTATKKFNFDSLEEEAKNYAESTMKGLKIGAAIKWGFISSIVLGTIAFIASKIAAKNSQ